MSDLPIQPRSEPHGRYAGKRGVGYVRLSDAELGLGYSFEAHTEYIKRYAAERGIILISVPGAEDGIIREIASGRRRHRTDKFELLERLAQNGGIEVIICRDQDRWFRNEVKRHEVEAKVLKPNGVELLFISEGDINSPAQREFMRSIKGAFAQLYAEQTREKIMESLLLKAERGEYCGGRVPYGYRLEKIGERTNKYGKKKAIHARGPDPVESKIVLFAKELYALGHSEVFPIPEVFHHRSDYGSTLVTEVLNALGFRMRNGRPFSTSFVKKLLSDPRDHHLGTATYFETIGDPELRAELGKSRRDQREIIRVPGAYPAIVPETLQRACQEKIASNRQRVRFAVRSDYMGSGLYRHSQDGAPMVGRTRTPWGKHKHRELRYMCANRYNKRGCTSPMVKADAVHRTAEAVFDQLIAGEGIIKKIISATKRLKASSRPRGTPTSELQKRQAELLRQKENLISNMKQAPDVASVVAPEIRRIQTELEAIEASLRPNVQDSHPTPEMEMSPEAAIQAIKSRWSEASVREKNRILKRFIRAGHIDTDRQTIRYQVGIPLSFFRRERPEFAGIREAVARWVQQEHGGG